MSTRHCLAHFIINQTLYNEAAITVLVVARRKVEIFLSFRQNIFSLDHHALPPRNLQQSTDGFNQ